jgi:hypothetical protein
MVKVRVMALGFAAFAFGGVREQPGWRVALIQGEDCGFGDLQRTP